MIPKPKDRFKPRKEHSLLCTLITDAWEAKNAAASADVSEIGEALARYFEGLIPADHLAILEQYNCISRHDVCNVRVYDPTPDDLAHYREVFGIKLPRKVPVVATGGYGYPSVTVCDPAKPIIPEVEAHFNRLLALRKAYKAEYKASSGFPALHHEQTGAWPTWAEIEGRFPVLAAHVEQLRQAA